MIVTSSITALSKKRTNLVHNGAVVISRGTVLATGTFHAIVKKFPHHQIYRVNNAVILPGLINVHTHIELPSLLHEIKSRAFPDWILNLIRVKKSLHGQDYASAAQENIKTLRQTGTTTVGDICTHGISPPLLRQSGLRAMIFDEIIAMGEHDAGHEHASISVNMSQHIRATRLMHRGLSPHSPYTVSEKVLRHITTLAVKRKLMVCMHVAESPDEISLLQGKKNDLEKLYQRAGWSMHWAPSGASSFEYLQRIGFLSPNFLAVHAVHVTDRDIALIKKSRVSIAHCPRSNRETGVGRMSLKKYLVANITVGLGTDSLASSPSLNLWDEMRYAYKIHKKDGITAKDIFYLATLGGARALGMGKDVGTLEPGKKADLIAVPLPKKDTGDIYSDLLRETDSCIMSMVNGKIIFRS
jgi:cytosine/adenosine deaminase-related metal-dependent hydrolase